MKIILFEDVPGLGEEGDIVEVKRGYARNYLLPRGFAVICTKSALAALKERQSAIEKRKAEKREQSRSAKEKIEAMNLQIKVSVGENGKLFGSVSSAALADIPPKSIPMTIFSSFVRHSYTRAATPEGVR